MKAGEHEKQVDDVEEVAEVVGVIKLDKPDLKWNCPYKQVYASQTYGGKDPDPNCHVLEIQQTTSAI